MAAKVARLTKAVEQEKDARMRMEGVLTYVEDQLSTLRAAPTTPVAPPPASAEPSTAPLFLVAAPSATPLYPTLPIPPTSEAMPAAAPASATSSLVLPTPSDSAEPRGHKVKMVKIPNPPKFYANAALDTISYEDWHLQMLSKLSINEASMPSEMAKRIYVQSLTADNALAQLKPRLRPDATRPFATVDEMFEVLTAAFGNANQKQEYRAKY